MNKFIGLEELEDNVAGFIEQSEMPVWVVSKFYNVSIPFQAGSL